ncbi:MAG: type II secretion system inner membrane protein GspF [Candidatus Aureabacteria bacterium]|nr:type II secretion system inner membrane protein GspF [Candidatus Auribacterota bacterium]
MPAFEYKALDQNGNAATGVIDADSAKDARAKLRLQQLFAVEIKETEKGISLSTKVSVKTLFKRVGLRETTVVTRQLATLLKAGLPLVRALQAIEDQLADSPLRTHIIEVREDVNRGVSLADALGKHPKIFSDLYVNMVRAGESAGALDSILERLATFNEKMLALQNKVRSAMIYPIFMSVIAVIAVGLLLTFVVPTITKVFTETKQNMPGPTVLLLNASRFMKSYWWVLILVGVSLTVLMKRARKKKGVKFFMDRLKLRMPVFGPLARKMAVSRFARTLSILTASGVPILKAMGIVRTIVNNEVLSKAIDDAAEAVGAGKSISEPLAKSGVFPPIVTHMIAVGETSGKIEDMLQNVADAYDTEVENAVVALVSLLEPAMIIIMGGVVGFIVFAILLPIFEMNQMVK